MATRASGRLNPWPAEAYDLARQAKALNFLRIDPLVRKLQAVTHRRRRDCIALIHACTKEGPVGRRAWSEEEIEELRELLITRSIEAAARKLGRSTSAVQNQCSRLGIDIRLLRTDLFSVNGLATALQVRKSEIIFWINAGWLEAQRDGQAKTAPYRITPDALRKCLRERLPELQKRNMQSAKIIAVFSDYCYLSKHTEGEQLLQVREAKRLRAEAARRPCPAEQERPTRSNETQSRLFIAS